MASDIQWRDVGVGNLDGRGIAAASNSLSAAGDVFTKLAGQLAARDQAKADLAFRENALRANLDADAAKLAQDQAQFEADMGFKTNEATLNRQLADREFRLNAFKAFQDSSIIPLSPDQFGLEIPTGINPNFNGSTQQGSVAPSVGVNGIAPIVPPTPDTSVPTDDSLQGLIAQRDALMQQAGTNPDGTSQNPELTNRARMLDDQIATMLQSQGTGTLPITDSVANSQKSVLDQFKEIDFAGALSNLGSQLDAQFLANNGLAANQALTPAGQKKQEAYRKEQLPALQKRFLNETVNDFIKLNGLQAQGIDDNTWNEMDSWLSSKFGDAVKLEETAANGLHEAWKAANKTRQDNLTRYSNIVNGKDSEWQRAVKEEDFATLDNRNTGMARDFLKLAGGQQKDLDAWRGILAESVMEARRNQSQMSFGGVETSGFGPDAQIENSELGFNDSVDFARDAIKGLKASDVSDQAFKAFANSNPQSAAILQLAWQKAKDAGLISSSQLQAFEQNTTMNALNNTGRVPVSPDAEKQREIREAGMQALLTRMSGKGPLGL